MRLTHRRTLALCAAAALALAAPAVAAAHGSGHGHDDHHGKGLRRDQAHRRHLRGEPQLRQPLRRLGGRQRAAPRRRRAHDAGQPGRHALHLPAAERREPDVAAAAARRARDTTTATPFDEPLPQRAVPDRRLHPADGHDVPGARASSPPNGVLERHRACRAAARATSCTATTRSSTSSTAASRTATSTGSDAVGLTMGYYDTRALPIYKYLHAPRPPATTRSPTTSSRRAFGGSFLNHQWLVAAATPTWPDARQRRRADDLHSVRRRQRDADAATRSTPADDRRRSARRPAADAPAVPAAGRRQPGLRLRRLRRQHDPADLPALRARHAPTPAGSRRRRRRRSATA